MCPRTHVRSVRGHVSGVSESVRGHMSECPKYVRGHMSGVSGVRRVRVSEVSEGVRGCPAICPYVEQFNTLALLLIEVGSSESHELLNSFWMGPSGSWDPHGVERTPRRGLAAPPKSLHTLRSVFHTDNAPKSLCADDFRALDLLLESARGAGSKPHATPIGARTTAIHLVNALGGKKVRSRRARDANNMANKSA